MKHLSILILLFTNLVWSQITPQQMVNNMGRGINIGNVLSAPVEGNWAPALQQTYIQDIANVGFTTVRIPMDFFGTRTTGDTSIYSSAAGTAGSYTGNPSDYIVNSTYLDRVEEVITWALDENLIVILDFHGSTLKDEFVDTFDPVIGGVSNPLYTEPTSAKRAADNEKFRAIWAQIANRLKDYSYNLAFEVVNEPYFRMSASEMDVLNTDIINIIRATGSNNSDRNIIITGGGQNSFEAPQQIGSTVLSSDDNLIATFHYYLPRAFTASSSETLNDFDWGTAADKTQVDADFATVVTWASNNSIPVLLGEFGADNEGGYDYDSETYGAFGGPDNASRVEYHSYIAEKAIELGFAFTAWDAGDKSNKTIYIQNNRSWVVDVRNALLGVGCLSSGVISNADIECGYDIDWDLFTQNGAVATNTNAPTANVRSGNYSMEVNITTSGTALNNVILRNSEVNDPSIAGKLLTFGVHAKGTAGTQEFKIRLKLIAGGSTSYPASSLQTLTTDYQPYEFQYQIPLDATDVQVQITMGTSQGIHYFDDFYVIDDTPTLSNTSFKTDNRVVVYPNPTKDVLHIKSGNTLKEAYLVDFQGKKMCLDIGLNNSYSTKTLKKGMYFLRLIFDDNTQQTRKIIVN